MDKYEISERFLDMEFFGKDDYHEFVDNHFHYLKNISKLGKDELLDLFVEDRTHLLSTERNIVAFFDMFDLLRHGKHNFYYCDRGQRQTLVFFPMPQIAFNANFFLLTEMAASLPEFNILAVDNTNEFFGSEFIDKQSYKKSLFAEIREALQCLGWNRTRLVYNVVCYGTLIFKDFFDSDNEDRDSKTVFFAPMVHYRDQTFKFINKVVPDKQTIVFPYVYYIGYRDLMVVALLFSFQFLVILDSLMISPLMINILKTFSVNDTRQIGFLLIGYGIASGATALVSGPLYDGYGKKKTLILGVSVFALSQMFCATASERASSPFSIFSLSLVSVLVHLSLAIS